MSISTLSKFYYGHTIDETNNKLDFDEGGAELTATLDTGEYTLTEFCVEIKRALEEVGALTFTVTVNRSTRIITVAAGSNFTLRVTTGTNILTAPWSLMGFAVNKTGSNSYAGDSASGSTYTPQFTLQDYVPPTNNKKSMQSTLQETANGDVELVRFAVLRMIEMNIRFCTDIPQSPIGPITNNANGLANIRTFMDYLVTKAPVEFMPDVSTTGTFYKVILDSTSDDSKGSGYKLKERTDLMIPGYYDTQLLTFRVLS